MKPINLSKKAKCKKHGVTWKYGCGGCVTGKAIAQYIKAQAEDLRK